MSETKKAPLVTINWEKVSSTFRAIVLYAKLPVVVLLIAYVYLYRIKPVRYVHIDTHLLLEYIAVVRWPSVALVALLFLRPHLPVIISRIQKASYKGASLEFEQQSVSGEAERKKEELVKADPDVDKPKTDPTPDTGLETLLTSAQAFAFYTQIYSRLYGTQINALKRLEAIGGLKEEDFADLLKIHIIRCRAGKITPYETVKALMYYPAANILVNYDEKNKEYRLTNAGLYFIKYLRNNNLYDSDKAL